MLKIRHKSDCALHNAPAYEPKPCDCGGEKAMLFSVEVVIERGGNLLNAIETKEEFTIIITDFKVGLALLQDKVISDKKPSAQEIADAEREHHAGVANDLARQTNYELEHGP